MEWKEEEECGDPGPRHHRHREERRRDDDGDDDDDDYEEYASAWRRGVLRYLGRRRSRDAGGDASGVGGGLSRSDEEKDEQRTGDADDARGGEDADRHSRKEGLDGIDVDGVRHALAVEVVASFLLGMVPRRATLPQALMHLPHRSLDGDPVITALS